MTACLTCAKPPQYRRTVTLECIACCLRWLGQMTGEERQINAPVIGHAVSAEHLEAVREAWKQQQRRAA